MMDELCFKKVQKYNAEINLIFTCKLKNSDFVIILPER